MSSKKKPQKPPLIPPGPPQPLSPGEPPAAPNQPLVSPGMNNTTPGEAKVDPPTDPPAPEPPIGENEKLLAFQEETHLMTTVIEATNRVKKYQAFFLELGVNPYRQSMAHLVMLHDAFDTRAGFKGKSTS